MENIEIDKKNEREDEWLWEFLTLSMKLTNCTYDGKSFKGKTRKEVLEAYEKKAEGVDMKSAIDRYIDGLKEKYPELKN